MIAKKNEERNWYVIHKHAVWLGIFGTFMAGIAVGALLLLVALIATGGLT